MSSRIHGREGALSAIVEDMAEDCQHADASMAPVHNVSVDLATLGSTFQALEQEAVRGDEYDPVAALRKLSIHTAAEKHERTAAHVVSFAAKLAGKGKRRRQTRRTTSVKAASSRALQIAGGSSPITITSGSTVVNRHAGAIAAAGAAASVTAGVNDTDSATAANSAASRQVSRHVSQQRRTSLTDPRDALVDAMAATKALGEERQQQLQAAASAAPSTVRLTMATAGREGVIFAQKQRRRMSVPHLDLGHFRVNRFYACMCKLESLAEHKAFNKWKEVVAHHELHTAHGAALAILQSKKTSRKKLVSATTPSDKNEKVRGRSGSRVAEHNDELDVARDDDARGGDEGKNAQRDADDDDSADDEARVSRSDEDISTLMVWARKICPSTFNSFDNDRLREIMANVEYRAYERGQPLFIENDPSQHLVIVISGEVQIFKAPDQARGMLRRKSTFLPAEIASGNFDEMSLSGERRELVLREVNLLNGFLGKPVAKFGRDTAFGQRAVETGTNEHKLTRRNASAIASAEGVTEVLLLRRKVYLRAFSSAHALVISRNAIMKHLRSVAMLSDWTRARLLALAQNLTLRTFHKGEFIAREGEPPPGLFFIMNGELRVSCEPKLRAQRRRRAREVRDQQEELAYARASDMARAQMEDTTSRRASITARDMAAAAALPRPRRRRRVVKADPAAALHKPCPAGGPGLGAATRAIDISLLNAGIVGEECVLLHDVLGDKAGAAATRVNADVTIPPGIVVGDGDMWVRDSSITASSEKASLLMLPRKHVGRFLAAAKLSQKTMQTLRTLSAQRQSHQAQRLKSTRQIRRAVRRELKNVDTSDRSIGNTTSTLQLPPPKVRTKRVSKATEGRKGSNGAAAARGRRAARRRVKQRQSQRVLVPAGALDEAIERGVPRTLHWQPELPPTEESLSAAGDLGGGLGHLMLGGCNTAPDLDGAKALRDLAFGSDGTGASSAMHIGANAAPAGSSSVAAASSLPILPAPAAIAAPAASHPPVVSAPPRHPPGLNVGGTGISFSRGDTKVLSVQLQMHTTLPQSPVKSASSVGSSGSAEARGLFGSSERSHSKLSVSGGGVKLPYM